LARGLLFVSREVTVRCLKTSRAFVLGLLVLACGLGPAACTALPAQTGQAGATKPEIVVFAAASLTDAFEEIGTAFGAVHDATVVFNFAGSQQLAQQLGSGAPADVFASANNRQMQVAVDAGRVLTDAVRTFAGNRLVIVTPGDNPAAIATLTDLATPGLKLILADPAVPVGQYARELLAQASAAPAYSAAFSSTVLANVVSYEENVRAVLAKVTLGEADAGIVYASDVTGDQRSRVRVVAIPDAINVIASYPIAPVTDSARPDLAQAFVDFVLGPDGQAILASYGFSHVEAK
jgi:molybdate transport system substrate-binding protein